MAEVAGRVTSSVRALEGALVRVVAYASLHGREPTPDLARHVLRQTHRPTRRGGATLDEIQVASAAAVDVPPQSLVAKDRRPRVALARQVAMYLARELTDASLPAIGRYFGRNHTTVLHAHRRIAGEVAEHGAASDVVERARTALAPAGSDRDQ
jgi:chromosomal replication initiator protein